MKTNPECNCNFFQEPRGHAGDTVHSYKWSCPVHGYQVKHFGEEGKIGMQSNASFIEGRQSALTSIREVVEGMIKEKTQVSVSCPDHKMGCLVNHIGYVMMPEDENYNNALSDLLLKLDEIQNS